MALWFTRDPAHDEDKKLIDQLMNVMVILSEKQDKLSISQVQQLRGENTGIPPQLSQVIMVNWRANFFSQTEDRCWSIIFSLKVSRIWTSTQVLVLE